MRGAGTDLRAALLRLRQTALLTLGNHGRGLDAPAGRGRALERPHGRQAWNLEASARHRAPRARADLPRVRSEWLEARQGEFAARTIEDYSLALSHHLLPFFAEHKLSEITAQEVDRYKAAKIREREQALVRPLSNRTINKTLTRLGQILDVAVRYELIEHNPVKTKVAKLRSQNRGVPG